MPHPSESRPLRPLRAPALPILLIAASQRSLPDRRVPGCSWLQDLAVHPRLCGLPGRGAAAPLPGALLQQGAHSLQPHAGQRAPQPRQVLAQGAGPGDRHLRQLHGVLQVRGLCWHPRPTQPHSAAYSTASLRTDTGPDGGAQPLGPVPMPPSARPTPGPGRTARPCQERALYSPWPPSPHPEAGCGKASSLLTRTTSAR